MLRRGLLKLLGAAIAVPIIGWPARRVAQRIAPIGHSLSKWNLWIGGDEGVFGDPRCWSHQRVPSDGDCIALNTGRMTVPGTIRLEGLALIGPGHIEVEANPANTIHPSIDTLTITKAAAEAGCNIGTQGRTLSDPCLLCTCTPKCSRPCKGYDCGCEKCHESYQDFLSMPEI